MLCHLTRPLSLPCLLATLLRILLILGTIGCSSNSITPFQPPAGEDFSTLSWTQAFDSLHAKISREYAFTNWKNIDWARMNSQFRPAFVHAQANNDPEAYYTALRGYVHSIPDGHVSMTPDYPVVLTKNIGGGFGLTLAELDNGQVVVTWVKDGGPASNAGIRVGAVILQWDGKAVSEAITQTSIVFGPVAATTARQRYEQVRFLVRAPIGTDKIVTFRNPNAASSTTETLRATDDNQESLTRTAMEGRKPQPGVPASVVQQQILPGNIGYISVMAEIDLSSSYLGDHTPTLTQFQKAINNFIDQQVKGIIVDIRGNTGGSDQMAARFLGSFYENETLYEYQMWYNALTGKLELRLRDETSQQFVPNQALYIVPEVKTFNGPVVALVDNACVSSGEGIALGIKNLPQGKVVGFYGTNGSFGMTGGVALMPGEFLVKWPIGQSLDHNMVIQLDSQNGIGGVLPNVRVPMTLDNALRAASGQDVVLEYGLLTLAGMVP
jgi:carboxyl-terminal processing protease